MTDLARRPVGISVTRSGLRGQPSWASSWSGSMSYFAAVLVASPRSRKSPTTSRRSPICGVARTAEQLGLVWLVATQPETPSRNVYGGLPGADRGIGTTQGHSRLPEQVSEAARGERLTLQRCQQLGCIFHAVRQQHLLCDVGCRRVFQPWT